MKVRYFSFLFAALALSMLLISGTPDNEKREQWVDAAYKELKGFKPTEETARPRLRIIGKEKQRYLIQDKGLIEFNDGSWMYIIIHSGHDDEEIGDIAMAVDSKKKFYYCNTHICGGLMITSAPGEKIDSINKLLSIPMEGKSWEKFTKKSEVYPLPEGH